MRTSRSPSTAFSPISQQDYLRISQNARAAALKARRQAVQAFWAGAWRALRSLGQRPSVRLGAGHNVHRAGV